MPLPRPYPDDLRDEDRHELEASLHTGGIPDALEPPQLAALAFPSSGRQSEREAFLVTICKALEAGLLAPLEPPAKFDLLHPILQQRFPEARAMFNPQLWAGYDLPTDADEMSRIRYGYLEPSFYVKVHRDSVRSWLPPTIALPANSLLPAWLSAASQKPSDTDLKRPLAQSLAVLAKLGRLPAWLTRSEIFQLWYPRHSTKADPDLWAEAKARAIMFDEDERNGRLKSFREVREQVPLVDRLSGANMQTHVGWVQNYGFPEDQARRENWARLAAQQSRAPQKKAVMVVWIHRDAFCAWFGLHGFKLAATCALSAWLPTDRERPEPLKPTASPASEAEKGGRPRLIKGEPIEELKRRVAEDEAAGRKPNIAAHCREVAAKFGVNDSSLRKSYYASL